MSNAWQYYGLKMISRMVCLLPYSGVLFIGNQIGKLYYCIAGRQRDRALRQIQECLGVPVAEAEGIIKSLFCKLAQTLLEVMYIPVLTPKTMPNYVTIENRHYLDEVIKDGQGAVLLASHLGNWEWMGAAMAMAGFPVASVIKTQPNEQHTRLLNEYREMAGIELFTRGTSEVISAARALKAGRLIGLLADQDAGPNGLFVEFLGKMSSTPTGPTIFAKKFKVPVVPIFIVRKPEGGHRIILQPPLYYQDTGQENDDIYNFTVKITKIIESTIRQYPDEWVWFQKRWNTSAPQERIGEQA